MSRFSLVFNLKLRKFYGEIKTVFGIVCVCLTERERELGKSMLLMWIDIDDDINMILKKKNILGMYFYIW